jgi:hypothetical protein
LAFDYRPPNFLLTIDGKELDLANDRVFVLSDSGETKQLAIKPPPVADRKKVGELKKRIDEALREKQTESNGVQSVLPHLEFRFVAQPAAGKREPRVPADYEKRDYSGNSVIGRMIAKDKGFIWVQVSDAKDNKVSPLPVERLLGGKVREVLLADTPEHALAWDGKWSVEDCRGVPDQNGDGRFMIALKLNEAGGAALRALTTWHGPGDCPSRNRVGWRLSQIDHG